MVLSPVDVLPIIERVMLEHGIQDDGPISPLEVFEFARDLRNALEEAGAPWPVIRLYAEEFIVGIDLPQVADEQYAACVDAFIEGYRVVTRQTDGGVTVHDRGAH